MATGLSFLMASKQSEMADLTHLQSMAQLVNVAANLIHSLQRERGLSNLYLGHQDTPTKDRDEHILLTTPHETQLRSCLEQLMLDPAHIPNGTRLFSRIAYALHGLDALPTLRNRIKNRQWSAKQSTEAYSRLVAALLGVIFEAADTASDPDVSRFLVGLFNFMQGKEFIGQERAAGVIMFATRHISALDQQRILRLIESQERCLEIFTDFLDPAWQTAAPTLQTHTPSAEMERLRRVLCTASPDHPPPDHLGSTWFNACTLRLDQMRSAETSLILMLAELCAKKLAQAQQEYDSLAQLKHSLAPAPPEADSDFLDARHPPEPDTHAPHHPLNSHLDQSILKLLRAQERRLQKAQEELETTRTSLNERKVIERAKGLLMAHRHLSEEEAHRTIQQMAMHQSRRLIDVAESILSMADILPVRQP